MEKTTLYLPRELHVAIRVLARRRGRSQAAVIRDALQDYVERSEPVPLVSLGAGADPNLSGADVEEWLAANWHPEADWRDKTDAVRRGP